MYVESVPNRNSPPAILLRQCSRLDGKVVKRTLANLSDWPASQVLALRRILQGESLVSPSDAFQIQRSAPCAASAWNPSSPAPRAPSAIWSSP